MDTRLDKENKTDPILFSSKLQVKEKAKRKLGKCLLRDQSVLAIAPHHKKASTPELRYKAARGLKLYEKIESNDN